MRKALPFPARAALIFLIIAGLGLVQRTFAEQQKGNAQPGETTRKTVDSDPGPTPPASRRKIETTPIPIIFYTPESSLAIGGGLVMTFRDPREEDTRRPDSLQFIGVYTLKNQAFVSVAPTLYFNDTRGKFHLKTNFASWPSSFFGIGNEADIDAQDIDDLEERYMSESYTIQPWVSHKIYADFSIGLTMDVKQNRISEKEAGGRLDREAVEGADGGLRSGVGPVLEWDTRDHIFYPTAGTWCKLWSWHYRDALGSDFDYDAYALDVRGYQSVGSGSVLAFQGIGVRTVGEVPFNELPTPTIRGLYEGVFVDENMLTLQMEYRFPIKNRWSGVAFAALGDVFHDGENYDISGIKYAGGGGIRFTLNQKETINLRFDVGVSRYGIYPYVMFQEAF